MFLASDHWWMIMLARWNSAALATERLLYAEPVGRRRSPSRLPTVAPVRPHPATSSPA